MRRVLTLIALVMASSLTLSVTGANAAPPPFLFQAPEDGAPGEGAAQIRLPLGVATDPNPPGHVYVSDASNVRISEFTAWGEFVKAWGWGVRTGANELQTCTGATTCQKGNAGNGAGQFSNPEAISVDDAGMVYVIEGANKRVQKFDPTGGPGEDGAVLVDSFGETGSGEGQFSGGEFAYLARMAACTTDNSILIGEGERVQRFDSDGNFKDLPLKGLGETIVSLTLDSACNVYLAFEGEAPVKKYSLAGTELQTFTPNESTDRPRALALDTAENLYMILGKNSGEPERVQKYDATGKCLACGTEGEGGDSGFDRTTHSQLFAIGAASCEADGVFVAHFTAVTPAESFIRSYGETPNPVPCPPPLRPPVVESQFALSVETTSADIRAEINPKSWSGSVGTTNYYVQYGTAKCVEEGGWGAPCVSLTATPPGPVLDGGPVNAPVPTAIIGLEGLAPATTYSYRFVAESTGGGPVYGEDPDGPGGEGEATFEDGLGATFRTFPADSEPPECPPNPFRTGTSELLTDCRSYEMVSPLDKEGGDIVSLLENTTNLPAVLSQAAVSGERMAYGSYRSFGGARSAPYTSQYVATRKEGVGWSSHGVSPPMGKAVYPGTQPRFDNELRAFSPDLCTAWVQTFAEPPLAGGAPAGFSDLYRRTDEECGALGYAALNTVAPPNQTGELFKLEFQGRSDDSNTAIFTANDALAEGAIASTFQLYGRRGEVQRMLCVLPGGAPLGGACTGGGTTVPVNSGRNRRTNLQGAISAAGERVFWTATNGGPGKIYLREHPFSEEGECASASAPCTTQVSDEAEADEGTTGSQFQLAAKDGSRVLFTTGGSLYEYVVASEETNLIAEEVVGALVGASEDATRTYLASEDVLAGANPEGKEAVAGEPNLYFHDAESFQFIGVLEGADLSNVAPSPIGFEPALHTSRVSPSGFDMALTSVAPLSGYDNRDAVDGAVNAEVFIYDAAANGGQGQLRCASCNPSGQRPRGRVVFEGENIRAAARLPVFQNSLYGSRLLADDGNRLFFTAQDALTLRDSNGREDVYQWEAPGTGTCEESSPSYSPQNGGCVDLISSGQSRLDSVFLDASPSGSDVFFTTVASLVPQDFGLVDVYDARVEGGLPSPPPPAPECEGETCQSPPQAPEYPTPATGNVGPGNLAPQKPKGCPKGKHKAKNKAGKSVCVTNKKKGAKKSKGSKARGGTSR